MDSLFFWAAKLARPLLSFEGLLLLLLIASWSLSFIGATKRGRRLLGWAITLAFTIALLPVGEWLLHPLESRYPINTLPERVDGIVVLSGGENAVTSSLWHQPELNGAAERNLAFMELARHYPDAKLLFSGGSGRLNSQEVKDADVARELFQKQGIDTSRITFERDSRNTYENALYSKERGKPRAGEQWLLITSAWHMPRAVGTFCKAGWNITPYAVDHQTQPGRLLRFEVDFANNLQKVNTAIREWVGLVVYYATGKTTRLLPQLCNS